MNFWNPLETHRAEQAYAQNKKALGERPDLVTVDGTMASHEFDDQGNVINPRSSAETRYDVEGGSGLLRDTTDPAAWMKYATELTKTPGGSPIGSSMLTQMNAGRIAVNKAYVDNDIMQKNINNLRDDIIDTANGEKPMEKGTPQPSPLANQINQNVSGAQPNMPVTAPVRPQVASSPNLGSNVPPQKAPAIGDSRSPTGMVTPSAPTERDAEYTKKRNGLLTKLALTGMPGTQGAKAAFENQLKALDVEYQQGQFATSMIQNFNAAKNNGYKGDMEAWKKAGGLNMAPPMPTMLTDQQKIGLGILAPNGGPDPTPMYINGKGDVKPVNMKVTDASERTSAAYEAMMSNLEPQLRELAPVNGFDMNLVRQEAAEMLKWLPMKMSNLIQTGKGQKRKAAQDAWLNANGRDESGATIKDEEMDKYRDYYFTSVWDEAPAIEFKAKLREQAVNGMRMKAGKASGIAENVFLSEYKMRASANKMVYTDHNNTHIFGVNEFGEDVRIPIGGE